MSERENWTSPRQLFMTPAKSNPNMVLPNCSLVEAGNIFLPHERTVHSSFPVWGIIVRPPRTLKMSGHFWQMWLVQQGQFEIDFLKLVWSQTRHGRILSSAKASYSFPRVIRISLLMTGLRFPSVINPNLSWFSLQKKGSEETWRSLQTRPCHHSKTWGWISNLLAHLRL